MAPRVTLATQKWASRWEELVPLDVARKQARWEIGASVDRALRAGATLTTIWYKLRTSAQFARLVRLFYLSTSSPVEKYLARTEIHRLNVGAAQSRRGPLRVGLERDIVEKRYSSRGKRVLTPLRT